MKKWEYKEVVNSTSSSDSFPGPLPAEELNKYGEDGWELFAINGYQYLFKRSYDVLDS